MSFKERGTFLKSSNLRKIFLQFTNLLFLLKKKPQARLKMDKNTTTGRCHQNIMRVTKNLILSHKLHTTIGSLSGGQKKRLSLAVQVSISS